MRFWDVVAYTFLGFRLLFVIVAGFAILVSLWQWLHDNTWHRARKANPGELEQVPRNIRQAFFVKTKLCVYCQKEFWHNEVDHIVAEARGGSRSWKNMIRVCRDCNHAKSSLPLREFAKRKGYDYDAIVERLISMGKSLDDSVAPALQQEPQQYAIPAKSKASDW